MTIHYDISDVAPYINWVYYFHAWQVKESGEQQRLRQEAEEYLNRLQGSYRTHALLMLCPAASDGDDIVVSCAENEENTAREVRIPCLRQQEEGTSFLCLADFIYPKEDSQISNLKSQISNLIDRIGVFATTVDAALVSDHSSDPYDRMLSQLLADRLAEATAERLHEEVRKRLWGYAPQERLSIQEMLLEHFQGIRPAVGYPSMPDTSVNFILDSLLHFGTIGITLTENGAMIPHASVSGLMMANPNARYFAIGKIGSDQLADYALRRRLPLQAVRRFLSANL